MSTPLSADTPIADGLVGIFHYTLTDDEGETLDTSAGQEPMVYIHGHNNIIPGLERALAGRTAGESFTVRIEAADAYGEHQDVPTQQVRKREFPKDFPVEVGQMVPLEGEDGSMHRVWIAEVKGAWVTLTVNHPLAGKALNFEVQVVGARTANAEELAHGHAHGVDGSHSHHH